MSGETLGEELITSIVMMLALLLGVWDIPQRSKAWAWQATSQTHSLPIAISVIWHARRQGETKAPEKVVTRQIYGLCLI